VSKSRPWGRQRLITEDAVLEYFGTEKITIENEYYAQTYFYSDTVFCTPGCTTWTGCDKKKTDWERDNLKGKVKTRTLTYYTIKTVFGEIQTTPYSKTIIKYDTAGNVIESASYNAGGTLSGKTITKYDAAWNMIESENYVANGTPSSKTIYKYDTAGNMIETAGYRNETKFGKTEFVQSKLTTVIYEYYGPGE